MRRAPHSTEVWWHALQPVPHLPVTSLSQSVSPRRSGNWQSDVLGFVVTGSSLGKFSHHFRLEFHDESNGKSLNAQKLNHNTLIAPIGLNYPKCGLFQL